MTIIQYKLQKGSMTNEPCAVTIIGTTMSIPFNEANTDYQAYLKWVADGNTPYPAETN